MENIIVANPKKLEETKKRISEGGAKMLHILTDFDRTLTRAFRKGKNIPSLLAILRDENYLSLNYAQKARELYNKYRPIEIDPKLSFEEKKKAMAEWWTVHFNLLIKSGLNKNDLKKIVESDKIRFRQGFGEFMDFLKAKNIPLLIISSSGLGGDAISMFLQREKKLFGNVHIIANSFEWDGQGRATKVKQPVIHVLNKDEITIKNLPVFEIIKERKNVLLLGDGVEDIRMVTGFDCQNLIKIGFLNEKIEENLESFKANFDAVIPNDGSLEYLNRLLKKLIK